MSAPCPIFGFVVTIRLRDAKTESESTSLIDDLVRALESNGLIVGRGADRLEVVISREGSQATHSDRELVLEWAERWSSIADIHISDLIDLQSA
jgi:uncharacterized protein YggL (DUF469 family)